MKQLTFLSLILACAVSGAHAASARTELDDCVDGRCAWGGDRQSLPTVAGTESREPQRLARADVGSYAADDADIPSSRVSSRSRGGRGIMGLALGGLATAGGAYLGYQGMIPVIGGLIGGGPWVMAGVGALLGAILGFFIIPKIINMVSGLFR